jgi:raffinose/stachyose/melibiose transport system substrate-binding protein
MVLALCLLMLVAFMSACEAEDSVEETNEPAYDFSVYFGEVSDQVEIAELIKQYKTETGKNVEAIFSGVASNNLRSLRQALKAADVPAAYVVMEGDPEEETFITENGYKDETSSPAAFEIDGRGLAVDRRVLDELVAGDGTDALIQDLTDASYAEWHVFVEALEKRIRTAVSGSFVLNGHSYVFTDKNGKLISNLSGVFAMNGGDEGFYGEYLFSQTFLPVDSEAFSAAKELATPEAIAVADPPFSLYLATLKEYTDHIAGSYGPGIRGSDFVSVKDYGRFMAFEIFANGRAVFTPVVSADFTDISGLNAEKAVNLILIPIKLPYENVGLSGKVQDQEINANIPVIISKKCYVNAKADKKDREEATKFIEWMTDEERVWENSLERSVRRYYDNDRVIVIEPGAPLSEDFLKAVLKSSGVRKFLEVEKWTDERIAEFKEDLFTKWYDN